MVLPLDRCAEVGVKVGVPPRSKKTAVRMSDGTMTSEVEVFVRVTSRFVPETLKVTFELRFPLDAVNVIGIAPAGAATKSTEAARLAAQHAILLVWFID